MEDEVTSLNTNPACRVEAKTTKARNKLEKPTKSKN
jgi:hypothetical protein